MGYLKFSLISLKRSGNESRLFIILTAIISAMLFNFTNLTLIAGTRPNTRVESFTTSVFIIYLLAVAFFVSFKANDYLTKLKGDEVGIQILSGISNIKLGVILTFQLSILIFIGYSIGLVLGILLIPVFSFFMGATNLFSIAPASFGYLFAFFILQSCILGLVNHGFAYRNDITALLGLQATSSYAKTRYKKTLKFYHYFYFLILASVFLLFFIPNDSIDTYREALILLFIIPAIGGDVIFKTFIPLYIDKIKKKKYLNNPSMIIILNNLKLNLDKNYIIVNILIGLSLIFPVISTFITGNSSTISINKGLIEKYTILFLILSLLFLAFMIIFIGLSSILDECKTLPTLNVLGFSKAQIHSLIKKEIICLYSVLISIPLFLSIVFVAFMVLKLNFSLSLGLLFISIYVVIFLILVLVNYLVGIKLIEKNLI